MTTKTSKPKTRRRKKQKLSYGPRGLETLRLCFQLGGVTTHQHASFFSIAQGSSYGILSSLDGKQIPVGTAEILPALVFPRSRCADKFDALVGQFLSRRVEVVDLERDRGRSVACLAGSVASEQFDLLACRGGKDRLSFNFHFDIEAEHIAKQGECVVVAVRADTHAADAENAKRHQTLNLNSITSPSCTRYSLPSCRSFPASRAPLSPPSAT